MRETRVTLEELIYQKKSRNEIYKELKKHLKNYNDNLETNENTSAASFLYKHTKTIDEFLTLIYKITIRDAFSSFLPLSSQIPIALCALGSYGRNELCIYSDIDIMICYKDIKGYNILPIIEEILYASWDVNLKLGHRVHKVEELQKAAREDITIKSAMIEARFICGSKPLWFEIENELNKIRKTDRKEFISAKIEELQNRRHKNSISFEPNIKESRGGIRDANTLFWILNVIYGINDLKETPDSIISDEEYREFKLAFELLQKTRYALHRLSKKKNDILSFDLILPVAKSIFQQKLSDKKLEFDFFKKVIEAQFVMERFSDISIQKATRTMFAQYRYGELKNKRVTKGVYLLEGKLYASFKTKAKRIEEILELIIRYPKGFDISFLDLCRRAKRGKVCQKSQFNLFKQILLQDKNYEVLMLLYKSSLLHFFIPPFKSIMFLPQFDLYHKYPVDVHTIRTFYTLENIADPFIRDIYDTFNKKERLALKFMLFFHDIGKGRTKDHAILGKEIWHKFATKFLLEDESMVAKLILHHRAMSYTAQREDIYNENTILQFAALLKDKRSLDFLLVLTYCDMGSVGNSTLNLHTVGLLLTLYKNCVGVFENKTLINEAAQRVKREQLVKKNPLFLESPNGLQKKILQIETNMIFQKEKSDDIIRIAKVAQEINDFDFYIDNNGLLKIEIYRKIPLNLGYLLGKLSHLNIASMDIYKLFDGVKYFRIDFYENIEPEDELLVEELIKNSFDMTKITSIKKPNIRKRDITLDSEHSRSLAALKIDTEDQKGLLAHISAILDKLEIEIVSAKIHTLKGRAKDLFLIEKNANFWNNKEKIITSILE